jgi:hypothetical protein
MSTVQNFVYRALTYRIHHKYCGMGTPGGADAMKAKQPQHAVGTSWPFAIQHSSGPDGPWKPMDGRPPPVPRMPAMTLHRGWDNVDHGGKVAAEDGIIL